MISKVNSKKYNSGPNVFHEIYQAVYFFVYRKLFYRRKTTNQILDSVGSEGYRNSFSNIHVPFISFILISILFPISIEFQIDTLIFLLIYGGVLIFALIKLNNFNRRYFINQKRYQTILLMKWADFSLKSRIVAIIYLTMMISPFLGLGIIIFMNYC